MNRDKANFVVGMLGGIFLKTYHGATAFPSKRKCSNADHGFG
jgi:hypothetical protein